MGFGANCVFGFIKEYKGIQREKKGCKPSCVFDFGCDCFMIERKKMGFEANCAIALITKMKELEEKEDGV